MDIPKETRRESLNAVIPSVTDRQNIILQILRENGEHTAQEIANELFKRELTPTNERNFAAPRLTELRQAGKVYPAGKKICTKTGRTVTVWAVGKEK